MTSFVNAHIDFYTFLLPHLMRLHQNDNDTKNLIQLRKANSYLNIPGGQQAIALSTDCCIVTRILPPADFSRCLASPCQYRSHTRVRLYGGSSKKIFHYRMCTRRYCAIARLLYRRVESYDWKIRGES